jgi:hypothetical protein
MHLSTYQFRRLLLFVMDLDATKVVAEFISFNRNTVLPGDPPTDNGRDVAVRLSRLRR